MKHIHTESMEQAIATLNRIFPTDYMKDDFLSEIAGYPIYTSTSEDVDARWADLGCRIEIISSEGDTTIWIDEPKIDIDQLRRELAQITKELYPA